jgi:hypothetical protein
VFYIDLNGGMMSVPVAVSPQLEIGRPTKLFDSGRPPGVITARPFDVSPIDGRFLTMKPVSTGPPEPISMSVVVNWFTELRTLRPR